jgi:hypothetical protein
MRYKVTLHIEQTITAPSEEDALYIFHDDLLDNMSVQELAEVKKTK